ncbi:MAG: SAM-dependent chlorinase/fluorinase [Gammaproteobacteria bacterium]|nr:SAM-dependent chlorinase/fluorinase [Gammaproteobacteria bacterium]
MIVLFTDFGVTGPYVGQMKSVLCQRAPTTPLIDLMHDAPSFDPQAAAYLLSALVSQFPRDSVFLCVVDPGVGSQRKPLIARISERWFVGPDNGLLDIVAQHALGIGEIKWWEIGWQPAQLSSSFHGRDLFAPVAAMLANGDAPPGRLLDISAERIRRWPSDLEKIIYIDHFGNAMTGIRAANLDNHQTIAVADKRLCWARTFSDVALGQGFWYENSNGLVELAVNQGRADEMLRINIGDAATPLAC